MNGTPPNEGWHATAGAQNNELTGGPSSDLTESILISGNSWIVYFLFLGSSEAAMGGGAEPRWPFGVLMSPNRRVTHAKPTTLVVSEKMFFEVWTNIFFVKLFWLFCKTEFFRGILFRSELRNWLFRGTRPFLMRKNGTVPSLFCGIFRNEIPFPTLQVHNFCPTNISLNWFHMNFGIS
jgi:hypothetical protein